MSCPSHVPNSTRVSHKCARDSFEPGENAVSPNKDGPEKFLKFFRAPPIFPLETEKRFSYNLILFGLLCVAPQAQNWYNTPKMKRGKRKKTKFVVRPWGPPLPRSVWAEARRNWWKRVVTPKAIEAIFNTPYWWEERERIGSRPYEDYDDD